jgi:hypothetical protein
VGAAKRHGVVVQLGLFCGYDASHEFIWDVSPMNPINNVNGYVRCDPQQLYLQSACL